MKKFLVIFFSCVLTLPLFAQDSIRQNLGPNINTKYDDIGPILSPDGKTIYFVTQGHPSNTKSRYYDDAEDIWSSELDSLGRWTKAKHLSKPFNLRRYNSIECISPDGNIIYIRGGYQNGEYVGSGFSYILKVKSGWSEPEQLDIPYFTVMSEGAYTSLYVCPDGKTLLLSFSKYPIRKNYKNIDKDEINDLYVCFKTGPNKWSKPQAIKSLNTKMYTESTPFIAADNKTLYFSSDRPGGKGSRDIWMTKRIDDTWLNWSTPINMDDNINTPGWDAYYALDAKGEYAYMVTNRSGFGLSDIVRIKLKASERPTPVVLVKGKVLNSKTNQPISANITYNSLTTGKEIGQAISDPITGSYKMVLPYGTQYSFNANGINYIPVSNNIDLTTVAEYKEIKQDLLLVPIEVGQTIQLTNIFFDMSKSTLREESIVELNRLYGLLDSNPTMEIEIDGHTDNVGEPALNMQLSLDRATAVKNYLTEKGIGENRILVKGFGSTKPLANNDSEDSKKMNRRVEFVILKL